MKKVLSLLFAVLLSVSVFAQAEAVLYNFESEYDLEDWTLGDDDGNGENWNIDEMAAHSGWYSATSILDDDVTENHSILSPGISLNRDVANGYVSFWVHGDNVDASKGAFLTVNVYVNGFFIGVVVNNVEHKFDDGWVYYRIPFSSIPGLILTYDDKLVQFEIVHNNANDALMSGLFIDDFVFVYSSRKNVVQFEGGVDYDGEEAAGNMMFALTDEDGGFEVPECDYVISGYTFLAWYAQDEDGEYFLAPGDSIWIDKDAILTALWGRNYTVMYDANEGEGDMDDEDMVEMLPFVVPDCEFTREGFAFTHWNTEDDDTGMDYFPGDTVYFAYDEDSNLVDPLYLYAQWAEIVYTQVVVLDANGGTGSMASLTIEEEEFVVLPVCAFTRMGYAFVGWNTEADGSGTDYFIGDTLEFTYDDDSNPLDSVWLYAQWEESMVGHTIIFDANGGTGRMDTLTIDDGEFFALPVCTFTREGYTFVGWCTHADGSQMIDPAGQELLADRDLTFYAIWQPSSTESISATVLANVSAGPNPTMGSVAVSGVAVEHIDVIDFRGNILLSAYSQNTITLQSLPAGIYMLRIQSAEGVALRRIVKK